MILDEKAVHVIKTDRHLRRALGLVLDFGEQWVRGRAIQNKNNGPLTTVEAVRVIAQHMKVPEADILVPAPSDQLRHAS